MIVRKNKVRRFTFNIFMALSCLIFTSTFAKDSALQQTLPIYSNSSANNLVVAERMRVKQEWNIMQLKAGAYGELKDFQPKAKLTFSSENRPMLADKQEFILQAPVLRHGSQWSNKGGLYFWRNDLGHSIHPLTIPLALGKEAKLLKIPDFEEIWLDYTSLPGTSSCAPEINLGVSIPSNIGDSKVFQEVSASTSNIFFGPLKPLNTFDAIDSEWREKSLHYQVKRLFGLASDLGWVYVQNQKNTLIQRSLDVRVDNIESINIVVAPGTTVERINLMMSRNNGYNTKELVEFDNLQNITLPDGRQGVILNLRNALEARSSKDGARKGKQHLYLNEIFIFTPGKARAISEEKPILSMIFLGRVGSTSSSVSMPEQLILASNIVTANSNRQRLVVDLRMLKEKGAVDLKKAVLRLMPPVGAESCGIRIEAVRAVSTYNGSIPVFVRMVEDFSSRFSGAFNSTFSQYGIVQNPGIIGYLPLSVLTPSRPQVLDDFVVQTNSPIELSPALKQGKWPPYGMAELNRGNAAPSDMLLISSGGAILRVEGVMPPRVISEKNLLVLEGRSRAIEISWPLNAYINNKTQFYFGVTEGAEQLRGITLTLSLADGRTINRTVLPNQPLLLLAGRSEIRNVSLRFLPSTNPYRLKLQEIAFFAPTAVSYAKAFNLPLPKSHSVAPKPVLTSEKSGELELQSGRVAGLITDYPLRFSTLLDPALEWVRGVQVNYRFPLAYGDSERCPLILQFNWTNGNFKRQVCFQKNNGDLYIPIAQWLEGDKKVQNLGALKSIDWLLQPLAKIDGWRELEPFDLQFSVDGWAMISAADNFRLSPLFNVGISSVFANLEHFKEITDGTYTRKIWIPLEEKVLTLILANGGHIQAAENQLYTLDQVLVELRQPMTWTRWSELTEIPPADSLSRWLKWIAWCGVMLLTWVVWKVIHASYFLKYFQGNGVIKFLVDKFNKLSEFNYFTYVLMICWFSLSLALYFGGFTLRLNGGENYLLILGRLAAIFSMTAGMLALEPYFRKIYPSTAARIYGGYGNLYFSMSLVMFFLTVIALNIKLHPIADELAIIAFLFLVTGVGQIVWVTLKSRGK